MRAVQTVFKSRCDECRNSPFVANIDKKFSGIVQALAALRGFAEAGVNVLDAAAAPGRCIPKCVIGNGVADADVHGRSLP